MVQGATVVTGVAGFIGSHVAAALLRRGTSVIGIDNFDPFYARRVKDRNLERVHAASRDANLPTGTFTFIEGDLCDEAFTRAAFRNTHGVIHLAAKAGVRPSVDDPPAYARANVLATSIVLHAAAAEKLTRAVVASSSSVYGNCPKAPFDEEMDVSEPISPYAATKRACELLGHTHWHLTKMPTAMLRFFTVYGPGQRPDLAISLFMRKALAGEPITLYGGLETSRDYTYIDDIVAGVVAAYDRIDKHGYRIWNLGNSAPVKLKDMIDAIGTVAGKLLDVTQGPARPGDVERTYANIKRAAKELDFVPSVAFLKGLTMQWEDVKREHAAV